MRKRGVFVWFVILLIQLSWLSWAEIRVKRDKNDALVISNTAGYESTGKSVKSSKKSASNTIPRQYLDKIKQLSGKYGIKESLVIAVAKVESNFNPYAVSHKGAVGLMQLMRGTANDYGVKDRYNADQNLEAGIRHLKYLYEKYSYDLPLTLAAYNAGQEAVGKYQGVPPYKETIRYIRRVMEHMGLTYSGYFQSGRRTKIYKYITRDGRVIITDTLPSKIDGTIIALD